MTAFILGISAGLVFTQSTRPKLSENFPQVPIYPGAKLLQSTCADDMSMLFRSRWSTGSDVPTVMDWYTTNLIKKGWRLDIPPGNLKATDIQYAQFLRGIPNHWLGQLHVSVIYNKDTHSTEVELAFPAPDSEISEE